MPTRVVFRTFSDGDVIALFPDTKGEASLSRPWEVVCYQHVGQHGGAEYGSVIELTRPSTSDEAAELISELERIGYDDLEQVKRARTRTPEEAYNA